MLGIHPDLRRHVLTAFVVSAILGAAGLATLVAFIAQAQALRDIPPWVVMILVSAALGTAAIGVIVVPRWYREASRVVASGQPIFGSAVLRLESSSDSTTLYARLEPSPGSGSFVTHDVAVLSPDWEITTLLQASIPVSLYMHPVTSRVVAIKTDRGLLWSIPVPKRSRRQGPGTQP